MRSIRAIYRVIHGVIRLFNHLTSDNRSLAFRLLDFFELVAFGARLVLHIDQVVGRTPITFHAYLVLVAHTIVPILLVLVLVLHVLPPLDIPLHLRQSPRFYE